jgi:hypothetical protein
MLGHQQTFHDVEGGFATGHWRKSSRTLETSDKTTIVIEKHWDPPYESYDPMTPYGLSGVTSDEFIDD